MNSLFARFLQLLALVFVLASIVARADTLKVGVIAPLSGPVAPMGDAFRKGFALFEKESPECAKSATFIFEDGKYDGKATSTSFHKLLDADKVDWTIVWGNTPASVAAALAEQKKAPLLVVSYTPEAKGRDYVVSFGPKTRTLAAAISDEFKKWNAKTPAAVSVDIGNTLEEIQYVKDAVGANFDVRVVDATENDFRTLITKLREQKVDGLLLFLFPETALSFVRQAKELSFAPRIIGADIFADEKMSAQVAAQLPQASFVYSSVDPEFIAHAREILGSSSYFYEVASGYTLAYFGCELGRRRERVNSFDVRTELQGIQLIHSPIRGLKIVKDDDYGQHFENDAQVYSLPSSMK